MAGEAAVASDVQDGLFDGEWGGQSEPAVPSEPIYPREERRRAIKQRSFRRNKMFTSKAQKTTLRELLPNYSLPIRGTERLNPETAFAGVAASSPPAPLVVEIGFGNGETLVHLATTLPGARFVGVEVHKPGVATALAALHERDLQNTKVVLGDAVSWLGDMAPLRRISDVLILFPDPFPEDPERRLVRPLLLLLLAKVVAFGGRVHVATDVENYMRHTLAQFETPAAAMAGWSGGLLAERPSWRPVTAYERRGTEAGRRIWDMLFVYQPKEANLEPQKTSSTGSEGAGAAVPVRVLPGLLELLEAAESSRT